MTQNRFSLEKKPGMKIVWLTLTCLLGVLLAGAGCNRYSPEVNWGYDGPGAPEHWASLSEKYATCADGKQQSPIDITGYNKVDAASISFSYNSNATAVRNDGRSVHVDYAGETP